MLDLVVLTVLSLLPIPLSYAVIRVDRRRLTELQRARGWNGASTASALAFFSPLCVAVHFWVTRRSLRGIFAGLCWVVVVIAAQVGVAFLCSLWLPE